MITTKTKYRSLLNDVDFDRIESELKKPNIFQVLNISRTEIRHSNFLAWLFDPNGTHNLGKQFLLKFLRDTINNTSSDIDEFDIQNLNFNQIEIKREWRNIDLLIVFENLVVCIENKVDSKDSDKQLEKYKKTVEDNFPKHKKIFVYLTPSGDLPTNASQEVKDVYVNYSYQTIIEHLDKILSVYGDTLTANVKLYISDYVITLKREIMENDELNELANKIYKSHKEIFDFVFENKSDWVTDLYSVFEKKITDSGWVMASKNKGYARFLTKDITNFIPKKGSGIPGKESFVFQFEFRHIGKITFKVMLTPTEKDIQDKFSEIFSNINDFDNPKGEKWITYKTINWKYHFDKETENFEDIKENVLKTINSNWDRIKEIVQKTKEELKKNETQLKALC